MNKVIEFIIVFVLSNKTLAQVPRLGRQGRRFPDAPFYLDNFI